MLRFLLLFLLVAFPASDAWAQDSQPLQRRLTLSVGGYRFNDVGYTPAPSVEFAADLFHLDRALLAFGAALSWSRAGYGVDEDAPGCNHCPSYDYVGHGPGGHLYAELAAAPIPVRFSLGLFHQVGQIESSTTDAGLVEQADYTRRTTTAELGLGLAWPLHRHLEVAADARVYPRFGDRVSSGPDISVSLGVGVRL